MEPIKAFILVSLWLYFCFCGVTAYVNPYFWHITDIHMDPTYHTSQQSCNEDLPDPGRYGEYHCDAPYALVRATMNGMITHGRLPEFIIYTGDNPHHPKNRSTSGIDIDFILDSLKNTTDLLNQTFPGVPIVVALGNHDYYPKDQLPGESSPMYKEVAEMWRPWIGEEGMGTFQTAAYYTKILDSELKIRALVINTNLYKKNNDETAGQTDPAGQYTWMEGILSQARNSGEKVHLITHVPTGVMPEEGAPTWLRDEDNARLIGIIQDYGDIIVGYYSCHEHLDGFRLIYDKNGDPSVTMFVAPSVTPWRSRLSNDSLGSAHNPGIRKIFYDKYTGELTDLEQFYLDLPRANQEADPIWRSLYGIRRLYGVNNISAMSLHGLSEAFKEFGSTEFHNYYDMRTVGARGVYVPPCSCDCKFRHICAIQNMDYDAFSACYSQVACGTSGLTYSLLLIVLTWFSKYM